jgi:L-lactate utilization protein LutB
MSTGFQRESRVVRSGTTVSFADTGSEAAAATAKTAGSAARRRKTLLVMWKSICDEEIRLRGMRPAGGVLS